jgi:hypothetical protein
MSASFADLSRLARLFPKNYHMKPRTISVAEMGIPGGSRHCVSLQLERRFLFIGTPEA